VKVTLKRRWWEGSSTPERVVVDVAEDGTVTHEGRVVGRVEKGSRTYSPPVSKGSPIARYHKKVAEWHGWLPDTLRGARPDRFADTRIDVIRKLMEAE
jgi:hypothetical protein